MKTNKADQQVKILVVDDNPKNIQVIGTILREANYEVGFAMDGKQALELLQESTDFDLVLLDIKMPVLDGLETCKIIKEDVRLKEIPVIFLSASHDTENIISAFDMGGVDYLTKPFNTKELLARVNTHVQLKQRTLEVKNYALELEKLNATKDKFFSIIAHDLRNPYEGILMIGKTLLLNLSACSKEELKRKIELIVSASDSGNKLLENLMTWSRSQTGKIAFNPLEQAFEPVIQHCIEVISARAKAKNITISYIPSEKITVKTDEAMFCHVLRNLLTNAIKFTNDSGIVTIHTQKTPVSVEISVIDTGIGISESDKKQLFRIDGNICSRRGTLNETGSGLGLILCKEFIDKMGGTIFVESEQGKGSRFTFTLPLN